jgi:hypothetical protein
MHQEVQPPYCHLGKGFWIADGEDATETQAKARRVSGRQSKILTFIAVLPSWSVGS